jgi:deleted-in-malignant-brain-tumors protein 1
VVEMVLKVIPVTVTVVLVLLSQVEEVYPQRTGDVRLAGYGSTRFAGRVEMFVAGQWLGVCNDGFGSLDANVVCRQLGLGHAAKVVNVDRDHLYKVYGVTRDYPFNRYGVGPPIYIEGVNCVGDETHLLNCGYSTRHDCGEHEIIGVQCDNHEEQPYSGEVRLTGGEYPSEGRLEVFFNGQWGGVCSSGFDPSDGDVVCRQLGYTHAENISTSNVDRFGSNPRRVWLTNVDCPVNNTQREFCLKSCLPSQSAPEGSSSVDCTTGLVGLQCGFNTSLKGPSSTGSKTSCEVVKGSVPAEGELRIVDGPSKSLGRVEVYLNGVWGTVCGILSQFSRASADVMCRQLGYTTWSNVLHRSGVSGYGRGNGPRHITRVNCTGAENSVLECSRENRTLSPCGSADVMAINCSVTNRVATYGALFLEAGSGGHGHLFIRSNNGHSTVLSPICDHTFGMREGDVACRQMGYTRAISVVKNSYYATGIRPASISQIQCHGNETHLLQCPHRNDSNNHCDKFDQIGLQCSTFNDDREGGLRLTGREANSSAGAVEIFFKGRWNRICSILFKQTAADVACRQLGYSGAIGFYDDGRYGSTDSGIFSVHNCHGSEGRLFDCENTPLHPAYCRKDIAVSCSLDPPGEEGRVRLTGGPDNTTGRLEVYEYGRWGSVCSNEFDECDALVACKQLGFDGTLGFNDSFHKELEENDIPINIFAIHCNGSELNLTSCEHEVSVKRCNHSYDVVLTCTDSMDPSEVATTQNDREMQTVIIGASAGVGLLAIVVLLLSMFFVVILVCALRRRKKRSKMERDWVPGTHVSEDITFENLQYCHDDDDMKQGAYFYNNYNHGQ